MDYRLACTKCGHIEDDSAFRCGKCGSILEVKINYKKLGRSKLVIKGRAGIGRYENLLPVKRIATLGEGNTPLRKIDRSEMGGVKIFLKLETENPTKTFKDRGSAVELSKAKELGVKEVYCASTGNMGLSVAHYAKHLGINATIFISKGGNKAKIKKIRLQDAAIKYVDGDFNKALKAAEIFAWKDGAFICGDYHFRKEGQKTVAYEIAEQLNDKIPDYIFIPVGNGTLFSGVYKGFEELHKFKVIRKMPRMVAVQSEQCDPLIRAYNNKKDIKYMKPNTEADAIAVGYPTFGSESLAALRGTHGAAIGVSEDAIEGAVRLLEDYGVYAELGGGTAFAGFLKMYAKDRKKFKGKRVVVVVTGNNEGRFV